MKRKLYLSTLMIAMFHTLVGIKIANAQNTYFRENFATGTGPTSDPAASTTVSDYTDAGGRIWKFYGLWLTTGTSCLEGGSTGTGNRHIRSTNNTGIVDTAYAILPEFGFGINQVKLQRSRQQRRFTFWINNTNTTDPNDAGWTLANVIAKVTGFPNPLCLDSAVNINSASARRLMIKFEKAGNSDVDSIEVTSVSTILPVRFASFNAIASNGLVKLNWNIATELNTAKYEIQRSTNGTDFNTVGDVAATNAGKYNYMDNTVSGGIAYYRIKAVDKDGQLTFSNVIKLNLKDTKVDLAVSPNPVRNGNLNIQLTNFNRGAFSVNVFDQTGKKVFTAHLNNDGGTTSFPLQLPSALNAGLYRLQVISGSTQIIKSIMIQ